MKLIKEILEFYQELGIEFLECPRPSRESQINKLNRQILSCEKCNLHKTKTNYVPGEGGNLPDIMFIGEGPGETEDKFGRPFIGRAGQILDRIINKMGYKRQDLFIANIVKCRPPNNREPSKEEVIACLPYLVKQIEILNPRVIVCLGNVALNNLLDTKLAISKARGRQLRFMGIPVIPSYHPSFILHKRSKEEISKAKWEVWEDMLAVLEILKQG